MSNNPMDENIVFSEFIQSLRNATNLIPDLYIHLPIAGATNPIYRERVYCYELYYQLKLCLRDTSGYSLGGEVDKTGHPLITDPQLKRAKPDLLVHIPGNMHGNFIVIEVKPINADKRGIQKDLQTLTAFYRSELHYQYTIYLVYGGNEIKLNSFLEKIRTIVNNDSEHRINLDYISLFWHPSAGEPARPIEWSEQVG